MYGSSRLGTKDYLSGQHYALWDYTGAQPVVDSVKLNSRQPWYSQEYKDAISYLTTQPWGWTQTGSFYVQWQLGLKQYELNNHLGNVQATVTDKPVQQWSGSTWTHNMPALASAYDYYPFGMLMPGRYVSDTSVHCMTISTTTWVTIPWHIPFCEWCPVSPYGGALYYYQPSQNGYDMTIPIGGGATMEYTVEPNVNNRFDFEIAQISTGAQLRYAVVEDSMGVLREIASELITKRGGYSLSFRPTGNTVILHVSNEDLYNIVVFSAWNWFQTQTKTVQETILVDVCDEDKDRYRFGFNGQEKVNEWSGIGNFVDFLFRGQDTRTGRFISYDPLAQKYPWNSPYAFAENRVIDGIDLEGKEWSHTKDKEGNNNFKCKIVVVNASKHMDKKQLEKLKSQMKGDFAQVFGQNSASAALEIEDWDGKSDVSGSIVMYIRDVTPIISKGNTARYKGGEALPADGINRSSQKGTFRLTAHVNDDNLMQQPAIEDMSRDAMHELGHKAGLHHPWRKESPADINSFNMKTFKSIPEDLRGKIDKNLMNSDEYTIERLGNSSGKELTPGQTQKMAEIIDMEQQPQTNSTNNADPNKQ